MKNRIILMAITLALILALTACGQIQATELEYTDTIKARALNELELPPNTECSLTFIETVECAWHDEICEQWELVINGQKYSVGTRRKDNEITFVDVE